MRDDSRLRIYRRWAPVYDAIMGPFHRRGRLRALETLALQYRVILLRKRAESG